MAKKKIVPLDAPGVMAAQPDQPAVRDHMWQRHADQHEDLDETAYPYALPRFVHKDGAEQRVDTPAACEAALNDGWVIHPGEPPRSADVA